MDVGEDRTCDRHWDGEVHCSTETEGLGTGHRHWGNDSGWQVAGRQRGERCETNREGRVPELKRPILADLDSGGLCRSGRPLPDEADNRLGPVGRWNMTDAPFVRWNGAVDASYTCHLTR